MGAITATISLFCRNALQDQRPPMLLDVPIDILIGVAKTPTDFFSHITSLCQDEIKEIAHTDDGHGHSAEKHSEQFLLQHL